MATVRWDEGDRRALWIMLNHDSGVVLFLYREEYYRPDTDDKAVCEVHVAKQRNGPTGVVRLGYHAHNGRWTNLARSEAA